MMRAGGDDNAGLAGLQPLPDKPAQRAHQKLVGLVELNGMFRAMGSVRSFLVVLVFSMRKSTNPVGCYSHEFKSL